MIFKRISFYLALVGIAGIVLMIKQLRHQDPAPPPVAKPTRSPFPRAVAATGIIEATRENVRIATTKPGLVTKVFVEVGSKVTLGVPLFQLDDRETRARLESTRAQLDVLKATLATEKVRLRDLEDQLQRTLRLEQGKAPMKPGLRPRCRCQVKILMRCLFPSQCLV